MKKTILTLAAAAAVGGLTAYAVARNSRPDTPDMRPSVYGDTCRSRTVNLDGGAFPDFTYAAETAVEAVVYVKVTVQSRYIQGPSSIFDFFDFFGPGAQRQIVPREQVGSGSGVIIRSDGYIVTNNHVVANASKIEVTLNNNQSYEATLVGADPATDVAIIKIDAAGLPAIPFGDSDKLRLGEWVIAIGSPYDLRSTITAGIVSAKGRSMPNYGNEVKIESFIQTDAAVNPGNSGGALVDKAGRLVGVNTAIISQTGSYAGYSFAIPSNIVHKIADDLIDFGTVKRVTLGVMVSEIDAKKAQELKLSSPNGVYIAEVVKGGAAQKAGLKEGDVLVGIDSVRIDTFPKLQEALSQFRPGDRAVVRIVRSGKTVELPVVFIGDSARNGEKVDGGLAFYGSVIAEAPAETLAALGLKAGVLVREVGDGKMKDAGVQEGFVITYVNDVAVAEPQDVLNVMKKSKRAVYIYGVTAAGRISTFGFLM